MDQIFFFCLQKRNRLSSSLAKTRILKGRKKKTKYFHSVVRNFYNAIPLQLVLPRNFFHGHKGLVSPVIHCAQNIISQRSDAFPSRFDCYALLHIKIEFLRFDSSPTRQEAADNRKCPNDEHEKSKRQ